MLRHAEGFSTEGVAKQCTDRLEKAPQLPTRQNHFAKF